MGDGLLLSVEFSVAINATWNLNCKCDARKKKKEQNR